MSTETRVFDLRLALPKAPGCPRCVGRLSAAIEGRPLMEYAQTHVELRQALEKFAE